MSKGQRSRVVEAEGLRDLDSRRIGDGPDGGGHGGDDGGGGGGDLPMTTSVMTVGDAGDDGDHAFDSSDYRWKLVMVVYSVQVQFHVHSTFIIRISAFARSIV